MMRKEDRKIEWELAPLGRAIITLGVFMALVAPFVAWDTVENLNFEDDVARHVQNAFTAVSAPHASAELGLAIERIEERGLDTGCVKMIWCTQKNDLDYWYRTLVAAKEDADRATYEGAVMPEWDEGKMLDRHKARLESAFGPNLVPQRAHIAYLPIVHNITMWGFWLSVVGLIVVGVWHLARGLHLYGWSGYSDGPIKPRFYYDGRYSKEP